ncbi:hypothetical protein EU527_02790 [Candidatus Thorarchaeota archaeon]|nr:MAG: hypothetical protein EU527_02790 [Candidatus Thorarchaeota archaeon]
MGQNRLAIVVTSILLTVVITVGLTPLNDTPVPLRQDYYDIYLMNQDTTGPTIHTWGISNNVVERVPFTVWANVTDEGVGVRNVSVYITAPNYTLVEELIYNGSYYQKQLDPFLFEGEYRLQIRAYDMNNNTRTSGLIFVTITSIEDVPVDEGITMPVVVTTSILLAIIVIMAALLYEKRTQVN